MTSAEMPELLEEPTFRAAASFAAGSPANDTASAEAAMSQSALLRLGSALVVAGAAVIVGVLMAAVAVRMRGGLGDLAPFRA